NNTSELINISSDEDCDEQPYPRTGSDFAVKQSSAKSVLDARSLIARNSSITISAVNPKSPNKKLLGKRKFTNSSSLLSQKHSVSVSIPNLSFKDFGGNVKVIEAVSGLLLHLNYYDVFHKIGVPPPRGFLLHGPPGCGKTLLAKAIAGELGIPLLKTAGPELVGGISGESEQRIRDLFTQAKEQSPYLNDSSDGIGVAVIGATNNPDSLDPALRRAGRFDREICLGIPDRNERKLILEVLCRNMKMSEDISLDKVADLTPGYVGADLNALCSHAGIAAVTRALLKNSHTPNTQTKSIENIPSGEEESKKENPPESDKPTERDIEILGTSFGQKKDEQKNCVFALLKKVFSLKCQEIDTMCIEMQDIMAAIKSVQPSAKREGFATVPDISWNDIGSLKEVREKLDISIMIPVKYPKLFESVGVRAPSGILLYGPPGCGKTLVAKAVANEANINFISVKGPELLNMYVGESERAVRLCFQRARNSQPCVIFFDEIDALCPKRSDSTEGSVSSRVVNQVLTEMDGVEDRQGVFLMAATNRPDMVDPAVLRPGRLDKLVYVGLPNPEDRVDILRAITKNGTKPRLSEDIKLEEIGLNEKCSRYSGADLAALVREASVLALTEFVKTQTLDDENCDVNIAASHFLQAFEQIRPSVSELDHHRYERFHAIYGTVQNK
uniref:AAA+ ATPase domain-containing protein n=1 Tax=Rhodnius prolixus TaxID=13249 RepID=T1HCW5_RHOPR